LPSAGVSGRDYWSTLALRPTCANISPSQYHWVGAGSGFRGLGYNYTVTQHLVNVELYIDRSSGFDEENKQIFDTFHDKNDQIEAAFGDALRWMRLDDKRAS